MTSQMTPRGYLLIELLAAITLVGIAVAAIIPSVAMQSERASRTEQIDRLIDFDRRARLLAVREGPLFVSVDQASGLMVYRSERTKPILHAQVQGECYLLDSTGDRPVRAVRFDRLGRSDDYQILVRSEQHSVFSVAINGLTGVPTESEPSR